MTPRERAEKALTILVHETGTATVSLSGLTLCDVRVDLGTRLADAIADAEEAVTRLWVERVAVLERQLAAAASPAAVQPSEQALEATCLDCGLDYAEFGMDVLLPRWQWLLIHPDEGGLLCARCIVMRASRLPGAVGLEAVIGIVPPNVEKETGPFLSVAEPKEHIPPASPAGGRPTPAPDNVLGSPLCPSCVRHPERGYVRCRWPRGHQGRDHAWGAFRWHDGELFFGFQPLSIDDLQDRP